jgi:hypothetical protein
MLAHASTHSANFDENTTATVFSFSVIAYQWGWNYYFPRDVVEVLTVAPSLVGHQRAVSLSGIDPYASLLARTRHEYYSRLTGSTQLSAKHGKYVLNQFLLAALTGLRSSSEHGWSQTGLALEAKQVISGGQGVPAVDMDGLATLSQDSRLLMLKDFGVVSSVLNLRVLAQRLAPTHTSGASVHSTNLSPVGCTPSRLKGGTNAFRAHSTAFYVGNRLANVYSHLASGAALPAEFSLDTRRVSFLHGLLHLAARGTAVVRGLASQDVTPLAYLAGTSGINSDNIGVNLWLSRAAVNTIQAAHPWLV